MGLSYGYGPATDKEEAIALHRAAIGRCSTWGYWQGAVTILRTPAPSRRNMSSNSRLTGDTTATLKSRRKSPGHYTYPQLFVSDEKINELRRAQRDAAKDDPNYKKLTGERAAAYRAQREYLFANDAKLAELQRQLEAERQ